MSRPNPLRERLEDETLKRSGAASGLRMAGGGGNDGGMEEYRFANLEARATSADIRMDRIETKLDSALSLLSDIRVTLTGKPGTSALWGMVATMLGIALAMAGISFMVAEWVKP